MWGEDGWARAEVVKANKPRSVARDATWLRCHQCRSADILVRQFVTHRLADKNVRAPAVAALDFEIMVRTAIYMISLRRPPAGALSAAEGVALTTSPCGCGSFASGSIPRSEERRVGKEG